MFCADSFETKPHAWMSELSQVQLSIFAADRFNIGADLNESSVDYLFNELYCCISKLTHFELMLGLRFTHSRILLQDTLTQLQQRHEQLLDAPSVPVFEDKVYLPFDGKNYIAKLVGPGGSSIRQLEETHQCSIRVRGRGSLKDIKNEEQLMFKPGFEHLKEELHVKIESVGMGAQQRISACAAAIMHLMEDVENSHNKKQSKSAKTQKN